jgi:hypothetical protein
VKVSDGGSGVSGVGGEWRRAGVQHNNSQQESTIIANKHNNNNKHNNSQ